MSTSTQSSLNHSSRPKFGHRKMTSKARHVSDNDAYLYTLRAAYLAYLLQPRHKRIQHIANTSKPIQRSSTSINDLVKDFSLIRDSKSTRLPHSFMPALDKRITGVLVGQERLPEYSDPLVKRTFAAFLNEFKNPTFRKTAERDRRVEDLLLIFYARATGELQKGKSAEDDGWKLMVDRHVALFVRLISNILKSNDWTRERPELSNRLQTLESKLLQHDQDLADDTQRAAGGQSVEIEVPRSYEVKDMPLVLRACKIFGIQASQAQSDIAANRDIWTEKAALKDLKDYQNQMMLNTRATLTRDDFDLDDAFETWRKGEFSDLSQMMLAIIQSNPELAKTTTSGGSVPTVKTPGAAQDDANYTDLSRQTTHQGFDEANSYVIDQPLDMSSLSLADSSPRRGSIKSASDFTFLPPDARTYYRHVVRKTLTHDLNDEDLAPSSATEDVPAIKLLSPQSTEMLNEIALRWRIPQFTRLVLFLDVVREKFIRQEVSLETLDAAFLFVKEPLPEPAKKGLTKPSMTQPTKESLFDRSKWTLLDFTTWRGALSTLHDALLRELYNLFQHCYESKPPSIANVMYILEMHIYEDPDFNPSPEDLDAFSDTLRDALRHEARGKYHEMLSKNVSDRQEDWEFFNIIKLGQAVVALCEKIQKRYRKNPEIMGVNPLTILVEEILPSFAGDAKELVTRIMEATHARGEEIPTQDGFDLYGELTQIRQVHAQALPNRQFAFHIEGLLQGFVWRWIANMDSKMIDWIEGAVAQDDFKVRVEHEGNVPSDDERHSGSVVDTYRIFNQVIEQIVELKWDDDLQYAKFMTAISKAVGRGIARYCELLEKKFAAEMDRQTPEQEAAAQRTQREKWIALARDAWTQKEKIAPFSFMPESFVKLNDIERATLQLDKLEKEINVDGCAEVIQKLDPPPNPAAQRMRGGNNCVFTIKIIEAEDLKAGDMNGLSDPYVVLGDEYQKRLAKTRTVYANLNPRWDESIDILTTGPLNVIATVWDWDALGDHDCLGRTSLKLDPNHFNDYMPREYWLDLDTQGRLLLRVSMEGERDDIQFYFGKGFRTLKKTERDMTRKITDKLSAYIHQCLSRRTLRALTGQQNMLSAVSLNQMKGYWSKVSGRPTQAQPLPGTTITQDVGNALKPLLAYFDDNFAIMKQTLTDSAMVAVMTRLWKEVLVTIESLLVPPLSDKVSAQKPLTSAELDVVFKWLQTLFDFFHAVDEESGETLGVPLDVLKSPKYHDLQNLNFFYFESTDNLIRTSEGMATATAARQQDAASRLNRLSAPPHLGPMSSLAGAGISTRRSKSIMLSRNLGTMRKAKEEKRKEIQADPNDDMILRILRMRPEAEKYLKDRSRQKERLAAAAAAELIVRQSLQAGRAGIGVVGRGASIMR